MKPVKTTDVVFVVVQPRLWCVIVTLIGWFAAFGCATSPTQAPEATDSGASGLDLAWHTSYEKMCGVGEWSELQAEFGTPIKDQPDWFELRVISQRLTPSVHLDVFYNERCEEGDGAACTLQALLIDPPGDRQGLAVPIPLSAREVLSRGCRDTKFGAACMELSEDLLENAQGDPEEIQWTVLDLRISGCEYGDEASCSRLAAGLGAVDPTESPEMAAMRDYLLVRGCQQGSGRSCLELGVSAFRENKDVDCFVSAMRAACEKGLAAGCRSLGEVAGGCDSPEGEELVFCDEVDGVIDTGLAGVEPNWFASWKERCDEGDALACHVLGRAQALEANPLHLIAEVEGAADGKARWGREAAHNLARSCEAGVGPDCMLAVQLWEEEKSDEDDERLLELVTAGCHSGHAGACEEALRRAVAVDDVDSRDDSDEQALLAIAGPSCLLGVGAGCLILTMYGQQEEVQDLERWELVVERFSKRCAHEGAAQAQACLVAGAVGIDEAEDPAQSQQFLDISCEAGLSLGCALREVEGESAAPEEEVYRETLEEMVQQAAREGMDFDQCIEYADQPRPVVCRQGTGLVGGQQLDSYEWQGRYGCGVTDLAELKTSKESPVEVCGAAEQHRFLLQTRCADGSRPVDSHEQAMLARSGNMGPGGRCGEVVDLYEISCPEATYQVHMDMYFCAE